MSEEKAPWRIYFDTVADAERTIKQIIGDRFAAIDTFVVQPSPAGEVRLRYRVRGGPTVYTTITFKTEFE